MSDISNMNISEMDFPDWLNFTLEELERGNFSWNESWVFDNASCCINETNWWLLENINNKPMIAGCWIYIVFSFLALIANTIVLVLLRRRGKQRTLFDLTVASLVLADLIISVTFLAGTIVYLVYLNTGSPISTTIEKMLMALEVTNSYCFIVSLLHVILITVERLGALFSPFKYRQVVTKHRIKIVIVSIWLLSSISIAFSLHVFKNMIEQKILGIIVFVSGGLLIVMYLIIAVRLMSLKKLNKKWKMEKRVLGNSLAVTVTFLTCLFPFAVAMINTDINWAISYGYLCTSFVSVKLFLDPVLYFFVSFWKGRKAEKKRFRALTLATFYNMTFASSNNNLCNDLDASTLKNIPCPQRNNRVEFATLSKNEDFQKWITRMKTLRV